MAALLAPICIVLVALTVRLPLLDAPGFMHDQEQFIIWAYVAQENGLAGVYEFVETSGDPRRLSNYPPVQIYICRALAALYPTVAGRPLDAEVIASVGDRARTTEALAAYTLFKWPAVMADVACALLLFHGIRRRTTVAFAGLVALIFAMLPNVWHNSAVWGAVDSLPVMFLMAALECITRKRTGWMGVFAALAVLTKPQTIIFIPVFIIVAIRDNYVPRARSLATGAIAALITTSAIIVPFHGAFGGVWDAYLGAPGFYPLTHLNGFSAWFLGAPLLESHLQDNLLEYYLRDDVGLVAGITARQLGVVAFLAFACFSFYRLWVRGTDSCALRCCVRMVPLAFFVCSTQMHERYLYPVVAMWAWSATPTWRWLAGYCAISLVAAVNVLWVWLGPFDSVAVQHLSRALHRPWLGLSPGSICAGLLVWIMLLLVVREIHRMLKSRQSATVPS
jgi:Gpi18-like mannosyltransferase